MTLNLINNISDIFFLIMKRGKINKMLLKLREYFVEIYKCDKYLGAPQISDNFQNKYQITYHTLKQPCRTMALKTKFVEKINKVDTHTDT